MVKNPFRKEEKKPRSQRNRDRLKNYVFGVGRELHDELPISSVKRLNNLSERGRRIKETYINQKTKRAPSAKEYLKRKLVGSARSFTQFLDGELIPHPRSRPVQQPRRTRPKKLVKGDT